MIGRLRDSVQSARRTLTGIILASSFALSSGCKGDKGIGALPPVIDNKVVNIDDEADLSLQLVNGNVYTFNDSDLAVGVQISPGTILTSAKGSGYLRVVDSVSTTGNTITTQTSQATLVDAVIQGELTDSILLGDKVIAQKADRILAKSIDKDISGTVIFNGVQGGVNYTLEVPTGFISFDPILQLDAKVKNRSLTYFRALAEGNLSFNFNVRATVSGAGSITKELTVAQYNYTAFQMIGILPVVEDISVKFIAGIQLSSDAAGFMEAGVNSITSVTLGAEYDGSIWRNISSQNFTINQNAPPSSINGNISLQGYVRPEIEVLFYAVAGPSLDVKPYLELNSTVNSPPTQVDWTLDGGFAGNVGFQVGILDATVLDYNTQLFDWRTVLSSGSYPVSPVPSGRIAFTSNRVGIGLEIYVMNEDGTNPVNLTNDPSFGDLYPSWSPNGTKIVFMSTRDLSEEIYVMNADGTNQTNITNNPAKDYPGSFSADGSNIAFATDRDGPLQIYVMNEDGTNPVNLTNDLSFGYIRPSFSPDGTKIAFESNRDGTANAEIYVMNADGSMVIRLTNNPAVDAYPSWSPDGSKIAFGSRRDGNWEIYVMNADGSSPINLTNNPAWDNYPSWSPDGTKIAFESNRDGNFEIYVMNADGSSPINLTNDPASDDDPSWSP